MVHSSLSACGYVEGGPLTIIEAVRQWSVGGTLTMPTHTYCYPDSNGSCQVFEPTKTPSLVGSVTDTFWRLANVKRSLHPTHSLACEGPLSDELIAMHEQCGTPCGHNTPYERLVEWDASVLMFGASLEAYTLFHTAEDAAPVPYLYEPRPYKLKYRKPSGKIKDLQMQRQDMRIPRRFAEMDNWLEERGLLKRQRCGDGELLWIPHAKAAHKAVIATLRTDPFFLVAS